MHQHDIHKVHYTHEHGGLLHYVYNIFVMSTTLQIMWESIYKMDRGFNVWIEQLDHLIVIMEICGLLIMCDISPCTRRLSNEPREE
jgi:hypothetical protein